MHSSKRLSSFLAVSLRVTAATLKLRCCAAATSLETTGVCRPEPCCTAVGAFSNRVLMVLRRHMSSTLKACCFLLRSSLTCSSFLSKLAMHSEALAMASANFRCVSINWTFCASSDSSTRSLMSSRRGRLERRSSRQTQSLRGLSLASWAISKCDLVCAVRLMDCTKEPSRLRSNSIILQELLTFFSMHSCKSLKAVYWPWLVCSWVLLEVLHCSWAFLRVRSASFRLLPAWRCHSSGECMAMCSAGKRTSAEPRKRRWPD
mmetsp:Transcript_58766/g.149130  ORF Transcript_58766/g.149130 Transcript_58766/m.149130 type:complete len:261 (+) Transcript_58766:781-1563(+)